MQFECAELSLVGDRDDNQDRVSVAVGERAVLMVVVDGMGGHAEGERAAEVALETILAEFWEVPHPVFDPHGFLHLAIGKAHDAVVALGGDLTLDVKPRATCAACLVQSGGAYWAHVGDSRIYHIRRGKIRERTRDHSHVEILLREGLISEDEIQAHPMRNFVECCLGGDAALPEMSVSRRKTLASDDVLMICTDGVWSGLDDARIGAFFDPTNQSLRHQLQELVQQAVEISAPASDNATAAAMHWRAD